MEEESALSLSDVTLWWRGRRQPEQCHTTSVQYQNQRFDQSEEIVTRVKCAWRPCATNPLFFSQTSHSLSSLWISHIVGSIVSFIPVSRKYIYLQKFLRNGVGCSILPNLELFRFCEFFTCFILNPLNHVVDINLIGRERIGLRASNELFHPRIHYDYEGRENTVERSILLSEIIVFHTHGGLGQADDKSQDGFQQNEKHR